MSIIVIENCAIAMMDDAGTEYPSGHIVLSGGRVAAGRLGSGIVPVRRLLGGGVSVRLGVDDPASSEGTTVSGEMRQALLAARFLDGAEALTTQRALWLATRDGAACVGRSGEIGALVPGMFSDVVLWRLDGLGSDAIGDPVTALVPASPPRAELVLVGGRPVVDGGELRTVDPSTAARQVRTAPRRVLEDAR